MKARPRAAHGYTHVECLRIEALDDGHLQLSEDPLIDQPVENLDVRLQGVGDVIQRREIPPSGKCRHPHRVARHRASGLGLALRLVAVEQDGQRRP